MFFLPLCAEKDKRVSYPIYSYEKAEKPYAGEKNIVFPLLVYFTAFDGKDFYNPVISHV